MRMHQVLVATVVVITACAASPAAAETIVITGGSVNIGSPMGKNDPPFAAILTGNDTFINGITFSSGVSTANIGETIDLSATASVQRFAFSEQLVQGTRYTDVDFRGDLRFVAEPVTFTDPSAGIHARFTMEGVLSFFRQLPFEPPGDTLFTTRVVGSGIATAFLSPRPGFFAIEGTAFNFSPVSTTPTPEPGTLALLGSGLMFGIAKLRRRRG